MRQNEAERVTSFLYVDVVLSFKINGLIQFLFFFFAEDPVVEDTVG